MLERLRISVSISEMTLSGWRSHSMSPDDQWRVQHMVDACEQAIEFAAGRTRSDLGSEKMLTFALVRAVEIIGEAASKVSAEGRSEFSEVPWPEVIGMRNRLVHAYFDVNLDIL